MRKFTTGLAIVLTCSLWLGSARAETITKDEYRKRAIVLFKEFLQMKDDGVFLDYKTIKLLHGAVVLPNKIRGDNPPGGYFARPPGSDWLKRVQALRKANIKGQRHKFVCFSTPKFPSGSSVCGSDLLRFNFAIGSKSQILELDEIAGKFWLATICYEKPDACKPYIDR